jgi:hypothetical protein
METAPKICSKAKCKVVLPPKIPGQQYFKTCEKCRNADALQRKKEGKEKEKSGHAPLPLPQSQWTPMAAMTENNPSFHNDMSPEETDQEDETIQVRVEINTYSLNILNP